MSAVPSDGKLVNRGSADRYTHPAGGCGGGVVFPSPRVIGLTEETVVWLNRRCGGTARGARGQGTSSREREARISSRVNT